MNAEDIFRSSIGCENMLMIKARIRLIFSRYMSRQNTPTVKPVQNGLSNKDKTNILIINGGLMKVESIAECSVDHIAILLTCIKR